MSTNGLSVSQSIYRGFLGLGLLAFVAFEMHGRESSSGLFHFFAESKPSLKASMNLTDSKPGLHANSLVQNIGDDADSKKSRPKNHKQELSSTLAESLEDLENAVSWFEVRRFYHPVIKDLVLQLSEDEFHSGHPFELQRQRVFWKEIVAKNILDYQRRVFRSPQFQDQTGYDLIVYELQLANDQKAFVIAKTEDASKTQVQFFFEREELGWIQATYNQEKQRFSVEPIDSQLSAVLLIKKMTEMSVPLLTAGR